MRYIYISFILLALLFSDKISIFKVNGMMCINGCVWKVNSVTQSIEGVTESKVNFEKGLLTVKYDSLKTNENFIIAELSKQTIYKVENSKENLRKKRKIFNLFNCISM